MLYVIDDLRNSRFGPGIYEQQCTHISISTNFIVSHLSGGNSDEVFYRRD
jgi:hypothetical protein